MTGIIDTARQIQDDEIAHAGIRWVYAEADEQHLLSAVFRDEPRNFQAFDEATLEVKEEDFGSRGHRHIWRAVTQTLKAHGTISLPLVAGWLDRKGRLEAIGGRDYLRELAGLRAEPREARSFAIEVRQAAEEREVQRVGWFIAQGNATPAEKMSKIREVLMKVETAWEDSSLTMREAVEQRRERRRVRREQGLPPFYATGLGDFDLLLGAKREAGAVVGGGLRLGTINFVGGGEKVGKTRFVTALNIQMLFCHNAIVDWWSVEQLYDEIVDFHVANLSGLPTNSLTDDKPPGAMTLSNFDAAREAAEDKLWEDESFVLHKPRRLVAEHIYHRAEVRMRTHREEIAKGRPYIIIVDYTQSVDVEKRTNSERERIVEVCNVLRACAKNLGAIVIPVFHTNRGPDEEQQEAHDVYGSAQLAKDADNMWVLWRPYRFHDKFKYFMRVTSVRARRAESSHADFRALLSHCRYEEWIPSKHGDFETFHELQLESKKRGGAR